MTDQKMIREYNKEVNKNWKLLSRGKLDLDPAYEDHLKSGYKNLQISSGLKNLAEQEIMMEWSGKRSHSILFFCFVYTGHPETVCMFC